MKDDTSSNNNTSLFLVEPLIRLVKQENLLLNWTNALLTEHLVVFLSRSNWICVECYQIGGQSIPRIP